MVVKAFGLKNPAGFLRLNEKNIMMLSFSLLFAWVLAFPFEGQTLYAIFLRFNIEPHMLVNGSILSHFIGLICGGFIFKNNKVVKQFLKASIVYCIFTCLLFFHGPSFIWSIALISSSFVTGICVSVWSFYLKQFTVRNDRIKAVAELLVYSNIFMITVNIVTYFFSYYFGLVLLISMLVLSLLLAIRLPQKIEDETIINKDITNNIHIAKPLLFLCLFILVITINSGLMYRVVNPAFADYGFLTVWYWALPYVVAIYIVKSLPYKTNRAYMLYTSIAMIGIAYISFMILNTSVFSYIIIDTLMLGAFGVCDLFWWSILGEMLDFGINPAKIFGIGLSSNVLGVLLGDIIGNLITVDSSYERVFFVALIIIFMCLISLPVLYKKLMFFLKDGAFLAGLFEAPERVQEIAQSLERDNKSNDCNIMDLLTEREKEVAKLLLNGRTYKMIAEELYLSENTVKTHIKNIYSKYNVQTKTDFINVITMNNKKTKT